MVDWSYDECPWCGEGLERLLSWDASMAFSTDDDYYYSCVDCDWTEHKPDERFTLTDYSND